MENNTLVQAYAPDKQKLAELVIRAKGSDRTMAQFSLDTGISAPTLSRIANGKINNPLSQEFLEKIYAARCKDADFTHEVLLIANGMRDSNWVDSGKNYVEHVISMQEQGIALERHAKNAIVNAVIDRGVIVQNIPADLDNRRRETPYGIRLAYDFCLYVPNEEHQLWYFDVIDGSRRTPAGTGNTFNHASRLFLLDAWMPDFFINQKTSFIFTYRAMYEQFVQRFKGAPIKSAVTAILIQVKTEEVVEETWISASPEVPGVLAKAITDSGMIAIGEDDDIDERGTCL